MIMNEQMQRLYDGIQHTGSERGIIAIVLKNPELLFDIATEIEPEDFTNYVNKSIYQIMLSILDGKYQNLSKINGVVIQAIAQNSGLAEDITMQYLDTIARTDFGEENLKFFVGKVKQASVRREAFQKALSTIEESVTCEDEEIDTFASRQEEKFLDIIMKNNGQNEILHVGSMIDIILEKREVEPKEILGVPTGFKDYDLATGGLIPSRLKVVGASTKTGKSILLLNIAKHIAINENVPVLYIDSEMQTTEQLDRLISIVATELTGTVVPESAVTRGFYVRNEKMREAVEIAKNMIRNCPLYHHYIPELSIEKVVNLARKFQRQHGISWNGYENQFVLIFDYLKFPDEALKNNQNEYLVLGQMTNTLKNRIAGMLNIPVLAACQMNPRTTHGETEINSSHVSGSSKIIMYLNEFSVLRKKTEEEMSQDGEENGNRVWHVQESRNGGTYKAWLGFDNKKGVPRMYEIRNVSLEA